MTDETETKTPVRRPAKPRKPEWKIRRVDTDQPDHAGPVIPNGRFETEGTARKHIKTNYPRGREVFLENPDGSREHYSQDHEHQGDDGWFEFSTDETE